MKKMNHESALRRIGEIVVRETGKPLSNKAVQQVQDVLISAVNDTEDDSFEDKFSNMEVTILLADLRGFSSIAESYPAGMIFNLLNRFFAKMSEIIWDNQGTIDKFMGDSIMVLFGAPFPHQDDVIHAITCAMEMQNAMDEINRYGKADEMPELFMGVGINTGPVTAGLVGSALHAEYTVIGDDVNLTSRIQTFSLRGQVLISQQTLNRCGSFVTVSEPMDVLVKGKSKPIDLYEVLAVPSLGLELPRREHRKSPRVKVNIPFTYRLMVNSIVIPQVHRGIIKDIAYFGILSELDQKLVPFSDIKMEINMSLIDYKDIDIYAKVISTVKKEGRFLSGIEFTSVSAQTELNIKRFIQLLIQGSEFK